MQTAFKEWMVVVDALERGEQILILRKGGIREGKSGFQVVADSFWLFPTLFHQQREAVVPAAQLRYDEIQPMSGGDDVVPIRTFAQVVESHEIDDWEKINGLKGHHIWREETIRERFEWGEKQAIFALVVRAYQLPEPIEVPMLSKYGGCRSWVTLEPEMPEGSFEAVLDDAAFSQQLEAIHASIR